MANDPVRNPPANILDATAVATTPAPALFSIGRVSQRTGIAVETIRIWHRRNFVSPSARTIGGHRQYTDADVELLAALKVLVDAGGRIGTLSQQDRAELLRRANAARAARADAGGEAGADFGDLRAELMRAIELCDSDAIERLIDRPLLHRRARDVIFGLFLPVLREVGERWHAGTMRIASEHIAEKLISGRLHTLLAHQQPKSGPVALCACLPAERHDVGLLASAVLLKDAGFKVVYLGADLPVAELNDLVLLHRPALLLLSATMPPTNATLDELAAAIKRPAFARTAIVLGGLPAMQVAGTVRCETVLELEAYLTRSGLKPDMAH